jgi:hypothetical protein
MLIHRISGAAIATLIVLHFGPTSGHAEDRGGTFDSGQSRDLINHPVCWSADEPDETRYCDFAQKF